MFRGFVVGLIWGGLVSAGILSFLSLSIPLTVAGQGDAVPQASAPQTPDMQSRTASETAAATAPAGDTAAPQAPTGMMAQAPAPEAVENLPALEAAPASVEAVPATPVAEEPSAQLDALTGDAPAAPERSASPRVAEGAAPRPAEAVQPAAPGALDVIGASGSASAVPVSVPAAPPVPPASGAPLALARSDAAALAVEPPAPPMAEPALPGSAAAEIRLPLAVLPPPELDSASVARAEPEPNLVEPSASGAASGLASETAPSVGPSVEMANAPEVAAPAAAPVTTMPGMAPRASGGAGGFTSLAPQIPTNRLPRVGDTAPAEGAPTGGAGNSGEGQAGLGAVVAELAEDADASPIERFGVNFENPDGKPLLAVILLDDGEGGVDRQALTSLPIPVAFAVSASRPDAAEAAAAYRAAGFEVVVLADALPAGASPSDLEVAFAAFQAAMPEAVAVIDRPQGGFQGNRSLAGQVAAILKETGHGLVTHARGLNAAADFAAREGVPSVTVFRDLDAADENSETIRRYLDRAAFRAGQDGRAVVMGRTRAPTVTALFAWGAEMQRSGVALAPLSAVLMDTLPERAGAEGN